MKDFALQTRRSDCALIALWSRSDRAQNKEKKKKKEKKEKIKKKYKKNWLFATWKTSFLHNEKQQLNVGKDP